MFYLFLRFTQTLYIYLQTEILLLTALQRLARNRCPLLDMTEENKARCFSDNVVFFSQFFLYQYTYYLSSFFVSAFTLWLHFDTSG